MLTLATSPTFSAKVEVPLPGDKRAEIQCEFRYMPTSRLQEFLREAAEASAPVSLPQRVLTRLARWPGLAWVSKYVKPRRSGASYLCDIVKSWKGVDTEFSEAAAEKLCEMYPQAPALIVTTWATELARLRLGN